MIDVHAHLNFQDFAKDYRQVVEKSSSLGVKAIINVGANFETSEKAVLIAQEISFCFASVGIHPIHYNEEKFSEQNFTNIINNSNEKVVAIGETGFDYYRLPAAITLDKAREQQRELLVTHLKLAKKFGLPLIFHCRGEKDNPFGAYDDLLAILEERKWRGKIQGEVHCFSGDWALAQKFLSLGFYLGFTGNITFKNADKNFLEVVCRCPRERILAETDCPYLAPEPFRGKRNLPHYLIYTLEKIAEIKKEPVKKIEVLLEENSRELFKISNSKVEGADKNSKIK